MATIQADTRGILDDLLQRRCNSRVQHSKIQEMNVTLT